MMDDGKTLMQTKFTDNEVLQLVGQLASAMYLKDGFIKNEHCVQLAKDLIVKLEQEIDKDTKALVPIGTSATMYDPYYG